MTGILVPSADSQALAEAIIRLYDSPNHYRHMLIAAARQRIDEQYDLRDAATRLVQLFEGRGNKAASGPTNDSEAPRRIRGTLDQTKARKNQDILILVDSMDEGQA